MATVELRQLRREFGEVVALDGIDVEIGSGEFLSLLGPSGCGKTTILRAIAGLVGISAGEISIGGRRIDSQRVMTRLPGSWRSRPTWSYSPISTMK